MRTARSAAPARDALARASSALASESRAVTSARAARRRAKVPTPANRSATRLAPARAATTRAPSAASPACVACRKAPGGSSRVAAPMASTGRRCSTTMTPWFDSRARSCAIAAPTRAWRSASPSLPAPRRSMSRPLRVPVTMHVERLAERRQHLGDGAGGGDRAVERGVEHRASLDRDDGMRAGLHEADLHAAVVEPARVQGGAAPAGTVRVVKGRHRGGDAGARQGLDQEAALPGGVVFGRHHLQRAAATGAEIGADRRDAARARLEQADKRAALAFGIDRDHFARQRVRHGKRPRWRPRQTLAPGAERLDGHLGAHAARLTGAARRGGTRDCRRRRRSAKG